MTVKRTKQVQETRQLLEDSLIHLLKNHSLKELTVSTLCDQAGLSRRTFSRHFSSIDDLLDSIIQKQVIGLYQGLAEHNVQHFPDLLRLFFDYFSKEKNLLKALVQNQRFFSLVDQLNENISKTPLVTKFHIDQYLTAFAIGGMTNLLSQWIKSDFDKTPTEMAQTASMISKHLQEVQ